MKKASPDNITARTMWLSVAAGFLLLATAWTAFIIVARRVPVKSVPLATEGGRR